MKVAIVVPNPCNPDFRVVKQAETLAEAGHDVTVYCAVLRPTDIKDEVRINGVLYIRRVWDIKSTLSNFLCRFFGKSYKYAGELAPSRYFGQTKIISEARHPGIDEPTSNNSIDFKPTPAEARLSTGGGSVSNKFIYRRVAQVVFRKLRGVFRKLRGVFRKLRGVFRRLYRSIFNKINKSKNKIIVMLGRKLFVYFKGYSLLYVFYDELCMDAPDVIYCHDGATLRLGYRVAEACGAHFLFDSHELEAHRSPPLTFIHRKFVEMEEAKLLPKAFRTFTVGHKISDYLERKYGIQKPIVLLNAPRIKKKPWPEDWSTGQNRNLREDVGAPENAIICVYTGNVAFGRGCEDVIIGLSRLRSNPNYISDALPHFAMVGRVTDVVREDLIKLASKCFVEEYVHFIDPVAAQNVVDYISGADISIIPVQPKALSYEYAMPNKLFEATLAGLPILGTNLSEMGPFIRKYNIGRTFEPNNIDDFVEQFAALIDERAIYSTSHREILVNQFSWEAQEVELLAVFDQIESERLIKQS